MFSPKCETEYQNHAKVCADCQVDLVKSLPDEAGIPAMVRNEGIQDLFGFSRLTCNPISDDVNFFVNVEDRDTALELMTGITSDSGS